MQRNFGARLYGRVREGFLYCIKIGTCFLVLCAILGTIFAHEIVEVFRNDPEVVAVGTATLRRQMARSGLFFIPLVCFLPRYLGLQGVEMCQAVSDVCSFVICVPIAWSAFAEMRRDKLGKFSV